MTVACVYDAVKGSEKQFPSVASGAYLRREARAVIGLVAQTLLTYLVLTYLVPSFRSSSFIVLGLLILVPTTSHEEQPKHYVQAQTGN